MNEANQGDKAASQSNWPLAITHYTNALIENPRAPSYYIKRSTAYSRRKAVDGGPDLTAALGDVELALALARERGKRELIIEAQLRRAIVLFQSERFGDAGYLFDLLEDKLGIKDGAGAGAAGDKSAQVQAAMAAQKGSQQKLENELKIWRLKIKGKIGKLEAGDEKLAVTIKEYPDLKIPEAEELRKRLKEQLSSSGAASVVDRTKESALDVSGSTSAPFTAGPGAPAATTAPAPASAPAKIRHEWYQSQDAVVVTIYAKNVDKSKLETDLQDNSVSPYHSLFKFRRLTIKVIPRISPPIRINILLQSRPLLRSHRRHPIQNQCHVYKNRDYASQTNTRTEMGCARRLGNGSCCFRCHNHGKLSCHGTNHPNPCSDQQQRRWTRIPDFITTRSQELG